MSRRRAIAAALGALGLMSAAGLTSSAPASAAAISSARTSTAITVSDPVGDQASYAAPGSQTGDVARLDDTDLSGVSYAVTRSGTRPALTIVYRAAAVEPDSARTRQVYGTFIGKDQYVEVRSTAGGVQLLDHHLHSTLLPCTGASETRDIAANTATQIIPLSCLRKVRRVRGALSSWAQTIVASGDAIWSTDTTAPTASVKLNAVGHPASVTLPQRSGPHTIAVHTSAPGLDHATSAATADDRAAGDIGKVDLRIHRSSAFPHLTIVYHVGAVLPWTSRADATGERRSQAFTAEIGAVEGGPGITIQEATIPGSLIVWDGTGGLLGCRGARETRDTTARTVTQRIPLACLTALSSSARIHPQVQLSQRDRLSFVRDRAAMTRAVPLTSIAER